MGSLHETRLVIIGIVVVLVLAYVGFLYFRRRRLQSA
jgi:high-affinity Fe2+/Pb2+ permease